MPNDDKIDQLLDIPEFLRRKKDVNSEVADSNVVIGSGVVIGGATSEPIVEASQEALRRRRKRKSSRAVKTLKRLGWTASQLNKIDHRQASEYAYTEKAPPKLYERKKD